MAKELRCAEVGIAPECEHVIRGETEDEVMAGAAQHGRDVHGLRDEDMTPDVLDRVRGLIRDAV